jgi:hypothetical protein
MQDDGAGSRKAAAVSDPLSLTRQVIVWDIVAACLGLWLAAESPGQADSCPGRRHSSIHQSMPKEAIIQVAMQADSLFFRWTRFFGQDKPPSSRPLAAVIPRLRSGRVWSRFPATRSFGCLAIRRSRLNASRIAPELTRTPIHGRLRTVSSTDNNYYRYWPCCRVS